MVKKTLRPAIAMIELIFAIVIIGIVLMTAPMLMGTAAKSGYLAIQQENINEAASRVSMIMGYYWDEGNVRNNTSHTILKTDSSVSDLNEMNRTVNITAVEGYRVGTPIESLRNFKGPGNSRIYASSILGLEGIKDDIDDFVAAPTGLDSLGTGTGTDYIEKNINIKTSIIYIDDDTVERNYNHSSITFNPNFNHPINTETRNIKAITVTLTSDSSSPNELDKNITLRAFSCNIGGYKLEEGSF